MPPKRKTKKEKTRILGKGIVDIIHHGKPQGRVDGSVGTKPTVWCEDVLEDDVKNECSKWLAARRIMFDRNNVGMGDIGGDETSLAACLMVSTLSLSLNVVEVGRKASAS